LPSSIVATAAHGASHAPSGSPYGSSLLGTKRPKVHAHESLFIMLSYHKTNPTPPCIAEVPLASDNTFCQGAVVLPRPYVPPEGMSPM
jgi:hypothetical protein